MSHPSTIFEWSIENDGGLSDTFVGCGTCRAEATLPVSQSMFGKESSKKESLICMIILLSCIIGRFTFVVKEHHVKVRKSVSPCWLSGNISLNGTSKNLNI